MISEIIILLRMADFERMESILPVKNRRCGNEYSFNFVCINTDEKMLYDDKFKK